MRRFKKTKVSKETGQAAVEFALALLIFIPILFFIFDLGWIGYQRIAFEYGYMHVSWDLSARDLGDEAPLDDVGTVKTYSGSVVAKPLYDEFADDPVSVIMDNLYIDPSEATAELHNEVETFNVPSLSNQPVEALSYTRYMKLHAVLKYTIRPLTPIGDAVFHGGFTVAKDLTRTRVVASLHKSE